MRSVSVNWSVSFATRQSIPSLSVSSLSALLFLKVVAAAALVALYQADFPSSLSLCRIATCDSCWLDTTVFTTELPSAGACKTVLPYESVKALLLFFKRLSPLSWFSSVVVVVYRLTLRFVLLGFIVVAEVVDPVRTVLCRVATNVYAFWVCETLISLTLAPLFLLDFGTFVTMSANELCEFAPPTVRRLPVATRLVSLWVWCYIFCNYVQVKMISRFFCKTLWSLFWTC